MPIELFVPGRVCLFGEHSDWAAGYRRINSEIEKGYTLITGTNQGAYARVERHPHKLIVRSTQHDGSVIGPYEVDMDRDTLLAEAEKGGYFSYIAGVAFQISQHYRVGGAIIDNYKTDLPIQKGLSSSAAISVLAARAFNRLYDLKMTVRGEMEYAYQGEITTPSRCGRMDQGCAYGQRPILMTYDGDLVTVREVHIGGDFYFVIVDLHAHKDTKTILARLNHCFPFAEDDTSRRVQDYLGPINKRLLHDAVSAVETGDAERLGALMVEAQEEFDKACMPACPEELTSPVLHNVLGDERLRPHIWGCKGVGSQGDGTAQFLARSPEDQEAVVRIVEEELGLSALKLDVFYGRRVRKALIPAAGFGQHMYPASKAIKKELFPIVTADGFAKPIILAIIDEALQAGIEEVGLVIHQDDEPLFRDFFNEPLDPLRYHLLSQQLKDYTEHLRDVAQRITLIPQASPEGLGHAVHCAESWVDNEPFLLLLGDHLYASDTQVCCAQQLVDVYQQHRQSVVGLRQTPRDRVSSYGAVAGRWLQENQLLSISDIVEKPSIAYAESNLAIENLPAGEFLTVFGQYVLEPAIFSCLADIIRHNIRDHGLFQLTPALDRLRQECGFLGCMIQGRRFDIGDPASYMHAMQHFADASAPAFAGS